jgi:hypothetical protein
MPNRLKPSPNRRRSETAASTVSTQASTGSTHREEAGRGPGSS